jgi:hypothetical protein
LRFQSIAFVLATSLLFAAPVVAQSPNGTINGLVLDPAARSIVGAEITVVNDATGVQYSGRTNNEGIYVVPNLPPGTYRLQVAKAGFKTLIKPDIVLNVQDAIAINFTLPLGAASETVTVQGGAPMINVQDATVSTVVDRQFAENMPMNGRSFQTLIYLTPGVVVTVSNPADSGQFSINGQRAASNYWTVDGVSANIGISSTVIPGNGIAGALGSFSVLGGTNSLVSVDAMQEFRIQTSTYAPEFGRTPGGQISIATRSGTNQFHGTVFDYLRNDIFDANNWFNGYTNNPPLSKAKERQNDFGGTFSGPIFKERTFFFFSYEGLRLRLPQTALTTVPDASFTPGGTTNARANAIPALQPYLNAYPLPNHNSPEIFVPCNPATDPTCPPAGQKPTGAAAFNSTYSNPATLDAYSMRVDDKLTTKLNLFGRYNYSPSEITLRGNGAALSTVSPTHITVQTGTAGLTWAVSPNTANDLRFNYSRSTASSNFHLDSFGGAAPLASLPFPSPFTKQNGLFVFNISSLKQGRISDGQNAENVQQQINILDTVSLQKGSHNLKFGVDYRHLLPSASTYTYFQDAFFPNVTSSQNGNLFFSFVQSSRSATFLLQNLGVFAQDSWRMTPRLTVTYGVRWEVDFAPSSANGPSLPAVTGFNLNNFSTLALAPAGTRPFDTTYNNFAPRLGVAYQVSQHPDWNFVLRGGFGVFYDLATSEVGNAIGTSYPFAAAALKIGGSFPLDSATAAPPPITAANLASGTLLAFDPHLKLPYTLEWNVAIEQALGRQQSLTASYIGAVGRRLLQSTDVTAPNPAFGSAQLVSNTASSDYQALQVQFQRRLSLGLQAFASYTWAHSIDTGSAGSIGNAANTLVPTVDPNVNRGPSDFDVRNSFSAGVTYDIPAPRGGALVKVILGGWSVQNLIQARSATWNEPLN